jgi:signal peptidase I
MNDTMSKLQEEILSWGKAIVIAIFIALVVRNLFFSPYVVKGESMLPNLQNDNHIVGKAVFRIWPIDQAGLVQ